jgi:hypothetical protein
LLVTETIELIREALGPDTEITLLASWPETFIGLPVTRILPTVPTWRGWDDRTRDVLKRLDDFDLVVAVGGGYLRTGTAIETIKTMLVHGPQLRAAARASTPTIYLPQSIGPARFGTRRWLRARLNRIDLVMARDDRTVEEIAIPSIRRMPDLATAAVSAGRRTGSRIDSTPVLSIRAVRKRINPDIHRLGEHLGDYDGYLQSTGGGNDDRAAMASLAPRASLSRDDLMSPECRPRVVVAVRLHAALMALAAGHYVVHLAYERKGFGAFGDLGLAPWVHRVGAFDVEEVAAQVRALLDDSATRDDYDARIGASAARISAARTQIIDEFREHIRKTDEPR